MPTKLFTVSVLRTIPIIPDAAARTDCRAEVWTATTTPCATHTSAAGDARPRASKPHLTTHAARTGGANTYFGKGAIADAAAHLVEAARAARGPARDEAARRRAADAAFRALAVRLDLAAAAELLAAGYRRHDRGPWRRTRGES